MIRTLATAFLFVLILIGFERSVYGQDDCGCGAILKTGVFNRYGFKSEDKFGNEFMKALCMSDEQRKEAVKKGDISADVGYGLFSFDSAASLTQMQVEEMKKRFCGKEWGSMTHDQKQEVLVLTASDAIVSAWRECMDRCIDRKWMSLIVKQEGAETVTLEAKPLVPPTAPAPRVLGCFVVGGQMIGEPVFKKDAEIARGGISQMFIREKNREMTVVLNTDLGSFVQTFGNKDSEADKCKETVISLSSQLEHTRLQWQDEVASLNTKLRSFTQTVETKNEEISQLRGQISSLEAWQGKAKQVLNKPIVSDWNRRGGRAAADAEKRRLKVLLDELNSGMHSRNNDVIDTMFNYDSD